MTTATQARTLLAWFARRALIVLTWTLLASSAIAAGLAAIAVWQGWPEVSRAPAQPVDGEAVIAFSSTIFGIPLGAVGLAAFVVAVAHVGGFTRPILASGATRTALASAQIAHALLLAVAASAVAAVVLALEVAFAGGWIGSTFGLGPGDSFADGVPALAGGFGGALGAMLAGSLVVAVFLRWRWWVGVGMLATVAWVIPALAAWVEPLGTALTAFAAWPGAMPLGVVGLAVAHWFVLRRLPVP